MISSSVLELDYEEEAERICSAMQQQVQKTLGRRGVVLGLSGGIDSSVCAALCARALPKDRVLGLLMPERESSPESRRRGALVAQLLGIECLTIDLTDTLTALGCYRVRDEAIASIFPGYGEGWRCKLVIAGGLTGGMNFFKLVVQDPDGAQSEKRLPARQYLQIVAAQNFKQRARKTFEYFHADRLNFAVVGTPNRLEYDQGFFVKNGDGAADLKPIAHLYKTQVYGLGRHLGLPAEICEAAPSTDTYTLQQGQDEFYFALPYDRMDLALWGKNTGVPADEIAPSLGLSTAQAELVYRDIDQKRMATRSLHRRALLVEPVPQVRDRSTIDLSMRA